jgi:hypothetical protein
VIEVDLEGNLMKQIIELNKRELQEYIIDLFEFKIEKIKQTIEDKEDNIQRFMLYYHAFDPEKGIREPIVISKGMIVNLQDYEKWTGGGIGIEVKKEKEFREE